MHKDTTNSIPEISFTFKSFDFNEEDIIEAINEIGPIPLHQTMISL